MATHFVPKATNYCIVILTNILELDPGSGHLLERGFGPQLSLFMMSLAQCTPRAPSMNLMQLQLLGPGAAALDVWKGQLGVP